MNDVSKNRIEKLLEMNEIEIANYIETTWRKNKELQEQYPIVNTGYNVAFTACLVIAAIAWLLGANHLSVFALFVFGALAKLYGQVRVIRIELNIAMNNQIVAQYTVAGIAKKIIQHPTGQE